MWMPLTLSRQAHRNGRKERRRMSSRQRKSSEKMRGLARESSADIHRCVDEKRKVSYSVAVWMDYSVKTHVQCTIGTDDKVNVYIAELGAIRQAVDVVAGPL